MQLRDKKNFNSNRTGEVKQSSDAKYSVVVGSICKSFDLTNFNDCRDANFSDKYTDKNIYARVNIEFTRS